MIQSRGNLNYIFKGYDYSELAEYFNCYNNEDISNKTIEKNLKAIQMDVGGINFNCHQDVIKIREFTKLIEENDDTYKQPIWQGLNNVIEDGTFIKLLLLLYKEAWN